MKNTADGDGPEFSCPLPVEKIPAAGLEQTLDAGPSQRTRLAARFGLLELQRLHAVLTATRMHGRQMVSVKGHMTADVVQQCVVTLEPLAAHIEQEIDVLYAAPELLEPDAPPGPDGEDVEAIVDGTIDLGELAAQHLGIALDPYPRKPGLAYVEAAYGDDGTPANPFAELASLTKKPRKKD